MMNMKKFHQLLRGLFHAKPNYEMAILCMGIAN